jgi:hypothetical protein
VDEDEDGDYGNKVGKMVMRGVYRIYTIEHVMGWDWKAFRIRLLENVGKKVGLEIVLIAYRFFTPLTFGFKIFNFNFIICTCELFMGFL